MLAIPQAMRTWRPYLLGKKIFIQTDHRSLKYFMEQCIRTSEQQNWVTKLLGYDYEIVYRPGRENLVADVLSWVSRSPILNALFVLHDGLVFYKTRVVIPLNTPFMHQLLKEFHDTRMGGHSGMTPFQALYRQPSLVIPILYSMGFSPVDEVDHSLATRYALLKHVKENLATTRNRMKQIADHGRRDVTFQEGDLVFLKLQPYF
ncbi:hypothetical protein CK203_016298 [Vitis vinifera]|uniref:Reverse transcriptase RNase H-like domain-containing protein n=1 Tax=Vitis vinifera TaxID=29760 RepID=A0A438JMR9_VITVI|nr:hypothetical protein CK203_016298 [Vitis vinifera]